MFAIGPIQDRHQSAVLTPAWIEIGRVKSVVPLLQLHRRYRTMNHESLKRLDWEEVSLGVQRGMTALQELAARTPDSPVKQAVVSVIEGDFYRMLGRYCRANGKPEIGHLNAVCSRWGHYIDFIKQRGWSDPFKNTDLAYAWYRKGEILREQFNWNGAGEAYQNALTFFEEALKTEERDFRKSAQLSLRCGECLVNLGFLEVERYNLYKAAILFQRAFCSSEEALAKYLQFDKEDEISASLLRNVSIAHEHHYRCYEQLKSEHRYSPVSEGEWREFAFAAARHRRGLRT
ncbi:MAG: hypothetical protein KDD60_07015 [Bdellovibrionales bacterium]|nr:hypothetical protein [Bdellovibrionales bacterium]